MNRRKILHFTILWIIYGSLIPRFVWNSQLVALVPDILLCVLLVFHAPQRGWPNIKSSIGAWIGPVFGIILLLGLVSSIISFTPLMATIWGARQFARYGLIAYMIIVFFKQADVDWFKKVLDKSVQWNVLFVVVEFALGQTGDSMGGTFSGNGDFSIYLAVITFVSTADYFQKRITLKRFVFIFSFCFIAGILAEIKLLYMLLPMCLYGGYILFKRFDIKQIAILVAAYFLLIPMVKYALSFYYNEDYVNATFDSEQVSGYLENDYGLQSGKSGILSFNRNTCIERSTYLLSNDMKTVLVGNGIGSLTQSQVFKTPLAEKYSPTYYFYFTFSYVLLELGWMGFVFFLLLYVLIIIRFYSFCHNAKDGVVKYWSALGLFMGGVSFVFMWYNATVYSNYYFPFVVFAVCLVGIKLRKQKLVFDSVNFHES